MDEMTGGDWAFVVVITMLLIAMLAFARGRPDGHRIGSLAGPTVVRVR